MADIVAIRKEILDNVKVKKDEVLMEKIAIELDYLEVTNALDGKTNLESFYDIWKKNKGNTGDINEINSWTAWAIGMTSLKPQVKAFLPSRRAFARAGFPDIDMDFDYFRRQDIYDYLKKKYGVDNVANIGTNGGLKMKSAIRRLGKALDIANAWHLGKDAYVSRNEQKVTEIINSLPPQMGAILKVKGKDGEDHVIKKISQAYEHCDHFHAYMDRFPEVLEHSKNIEGLLTTPGIHAAGIVISNQPLESIAPLRRTNKGYATQYTYEWLEQMGLIKFDILAISTLTVVKETVKMIKQNYGIDINIRNLPFDDAATLKLFRSGNLKGVFQCETKPMQHVMKDIGVDRFDDIVAAIALFRPGPMASIPEYCARKRGEKELDYFHPKIKPYVEKYLKNTYGLLVYQEQLMQICNSLADFSVSDGYVMIKAIGKKKESLMKKFKTQFIEALVKKGIPKEVADTYWERFIIPFASYGFNLAHSAAYGTLAYICGYLKANYPDEFFCSLLNVENERKKHEKIEEFLIDAEKFNILLLEKDLNECEVNFKIVRKKDVSSGVLNTEISPSLMVKGVGSESATNIAENKPYKNLRDLALKTDTKLVDQDVVTCLVDAGFFEKAYKEMKKKSRKVTKETFKDAILQKFKSLRDDMRAAAKRGVQSFDIFDGN